MLPRRDGATDRAQSASNGKRPTDGADDGAVRCRWLRLSAATGRQRSVCDRPIRDWIDSHNVQRPAVALAGQSGDLRANRHAVADPPNADSGHRDVAKGMNIDYPFHFDKRGRTAATDNNDHIRDMIEEFLFTNPGERVNRPAFGSGLLQLVFAPNSPELAATVQFTIQAGLQLWLSDVVTVQQVDVTAQDSTLSVLVQYVIRDTGQQQAQTFVSGGAS
jgi:phage baseplate assembly protein W